MGDPGFGWCAWACRVAFQISATGAMTGDEGRFARNTTPGRDANEGRPIREQLGCRRGQGSVGQQPPQRAPWRWRQTAGGNGEAEGCKDLAGSGIDAVRLVGGIMAGLSRFRPSAGDRGKVNRQHLDRHAIFR